MTYISNAVQRCSIEGPLAYAHGSDVAEIPHSPTLALSALTPSLCHSSTPPLPGDAADSRFVLTSVSPVTVPNPACFYT
jgi:hypothetical protein